MDGSRKPAVPCLEKEKENILPAPTRDSYVYGEACVVVNGMSVMGRKGLSLTQAYTQGAQGHILPYSAQQSTEYVMILVACNKFTGGLHPRLQAWSKINK